MCQARKFVHLFCKITYSHKSVLRLHLHCSQTEAVSSCRHTKGNLEVVRSGNTSSAVLATGRLNFIWEAEEPWRKKFTLSTVLPWAMPELCVYVSCHAWLEWKYPGLNVSISSIFSGLEHDGSNWVVFSSLLISKSPCDLASTTHIHLSTVGL